MAVDPDAQARLLAYDWPGNVRQLQNVLERALVLAEQDVIGPEHLPEEIRLASTAPRVSSTDAASPDAAATLAAVERRHVLQVLDQAGGNRRAAAKILGISRRTLLRMLQRWGMVPPKT